MPIKRPGRGHCGVGVYISPECFLPKCPTLGLDFSGSAFQQFDTEKCRIKENLEMSEQKFRETRNLVRVQEKTRKLLINSDIQNSHIK